MDRGAVHFALNHIIAPGLPLPAFFAGARELEIACVEIRNDLPGNAILDGTPAAEIRAEAERAGVAILSVNALQRFNDWSPARESEAAELADYAVQCGAQALVLVPGNDGGGRGDHERLTNLTTALRALKPLLRARGLIGLVEPLGFETSSLRRKSEAVAGIDAVDGADVFRLVHDTFHHHLAGEDALFPERTGLVHISGVEDDIAPGDMRDSHRVLVGEGDRLGNVAQIRALLAGGYEGTLSFEPFADSVHRLSESELRDGVEKSMKLVVSGVRA
ncbi:TIM barrel protein [Labrys monachus]|uniref:2-keto-myo-inositol isomerase n=1 Tax=Labrys monachus TaxID=217067 RepID=A0ABU0FC27_9HYPH|nr:TIM barrel protein [Labrys monachus]MDQ0392165.1 2-keto-myo-inositol isomerase [Labrys monachus]